MKILVCIFFLLFITGCLGSSYEGETLNGKAHGFGTQYYAGAGCTEHTLKCLEDKLLPAGVALFGGGGAAIGSGYSKSKQNEARQKIWAQCMNKRGYDA